MNEVVLILDLGGQYKELIARKVRELSVYAEIVPGTISASEIQEYDPLALILTGGPDSVHDKHAPRPDAEIGKLGIPVLGICYGMQVLCDALGGEVSTKGAGEYGCVEVTQKQTSSGLLNGVKTSFTALMSHRDTVVSVPEGFRETSYSPVGIASCENASRKLFGVQFHPESIHTEEGLKIIENFLYGICGAKGDYQLEDYLETQIQAVRSVVKDKRVVIALSGGVDSSVCARLLEKAIPGQLVAIFVDHGLLRQGEADEVEKIFSKRDILFRRVNARERFLGLLEGVTDPEVKRKIIGEEFVRVFEEEAHASRDQVFLAQGTIYPDIVESGLSQGAVIKSHHNVGGFSKEHAFCGVIEPLAKLFKDEVRQLGRQLDLPEHLISRQPFPGPGLAIRIMGEVTEEKLALLRKADALVREEIDKLEERPDQYFAVLTDTRSVGVKGDARTHDFVIALRAVVTEDFMTGEYAPLPHSVLHTIASRITNEIPEVSRVVYDITSKPPATVEWE